MAGTIYLWPGASFWFGPQPANMVDLNQQIAVQERSGRLVMDEGFDAGEDAVYSNNAYGSVGPSVSVVVPTVGRPMGTWKLAYEYRTLCDSGMTCNAGSTQVGYAGIKDSLDFPGGSFVSNLFVNASYVTQAAGPFNSWVATPGTHVLSMGLYAFTGYWIIVRNVRLIAGGR